MVWLYGWAGSVVSNIARKLMLASGGGGDSTWILQYEAGYTDTYVYVTGVRSGDGTDDGNLFWTSGCRDTSDGAIIVKMDKDGEILLDKRINNSSTYTFSNDLKVDSSDNVFLMNGGPANVAIKLNSSLVIQSQQKYTALWAGSGSASFVYNDDLYFASTHDNFYPSARPLGYIVDGATMNVTGTPYSFLGTDGNPQRCVHVDGSGNIYVTNESRNSVGGSTPFIAKWGTDWSTETWALKFTGLGNNADGVGQALSVDSSGNVYNCGRMYIDYTNYRNNYVAKFNSSGTVQWMKSLNMPNGAESNMIASISLYAIQHTTQGIVTLSYGQSNIQAGKFDINVSLWNTSTGALISSYGVANITAGWRTDLQCDRHNTQTLITEDHVYIAAQDASQRFYIMKLPITDASGIYGTYNVNGQNVKIAANGFQDISVSNTTWSSESFSNTSRTITKTALSGYSDSAVSITPTLVDI